MGVGRLTTFHGKFTQEDFGNASTSRIRMTEKVGKKTQLTRQTPTSTANKGKKTLDKDNLTVKNECLSLLVSQLSGVNGGSC